MQVMRHIIVPLIAAFIWGTAFVAQEIGARYYDAFAFNMIRNWMAFVFLLLVAIIYDYVVMRKQKKDGTYQKLSKEEYGKKRKEALVGGFWCGVPLAVAACMQQQGIAMSGAGKAGFLTALYVVLIPLFGLVIKQYAPRIVWLAAIIAVAGLYFLCLDPSVSMRIAGGDWFLLGCAAIFSIQILCINHYGQFVNGIKLSCLQFLVAAIIMTVATALFSEDVNFAYLIQSREMVIAILYAGVMSSGVAYTLQIIAQKGSNPTVVSLIMSLESVFATVASAILLHEILTGREYLGCVLMFVAVILSQIPTGKFTRKSKQEEGTLE